MKTYRPISGFTLVEVLVSAGIVVVMMGVLISMTDQTHRMMRTTSAKVEQFQEARVAFEAMTRRLAQATLNTYWDYKYDARGLPKSYQRSAELRFVSGVTNTLTGGPGANGKIRPGHCVFFHTPSGFVENQTVFGSLDHLINVAGYFVEIDTDEDTLPTFLKGLIPSRKRYRLMEFMQPAEQLKTYDFAGSGGMKWFTPFVTGTDRPVRVLAENIVALIVLPRLSLADELHWMKQTGNKDLPVLAPLYSYDTTNTKVSDAILNPHNQLPPVVQVAMIAIDEPGARMLDDRFGSDPYLGINYSSMFRDPLVLEDNPASPAPNDGDLSKLETLLISKRVSYRIFTTNVSIRGAKWSRSQAN